MRGTDLKKLAESLKSVSSSKSQSATSTNELAVFFEYYPSVAENDTVRFAFLTRIGNIKGNCTSSAADAGDFINLSEVDFTDNAGKITKFEILHLRVADVVALSPICSVSTESILAWHSEFEASEVAD